MCSVLGWTCATFISGLNVRTNPVWFCENVKNRMPSTHKMMMHVVLLSMGVVCTATPAIAVVGSVNVDITMQANGMKKVWCYSLQLGNLRFLGQNNQFHFCFGWEISPFYMKRWYSRYLHYEEEETLWKMAETNPWEVQRLPQQHETLTASVPSVELALGGPSFGAWCVGLWGIPDLHYKIHQDTYFGGLCFYHYPKKSPKRYYEAVA